MSTIENSNKEAHLKSLDRVQNYPIVSDSVVVALSYYHWLKSKNSLIDNTLSCAERTLKTIKDTTEPIIANKLGFIDNAIYNQLDHLEKKCPIILEPSSKIAEIPSQVYHDKLEPTVKTIMQPVTQTMETVSKTSNMAISLVESSINKILPSEIVSEKTSNYIIDKSEELLDKYLPDDEDTNDESNENLNIRSKVQHLSVKTQRRLYKKAMEKIDLLHKSSLEKLEQIKSVFADLQNKKENLQSALIEDYSHAIETIKNIPSTLTKHSELLRDTLEYSKTIQKSFSSSANSVLEQSLSTTITGITHLHENLLKLQDLISDQKPNFISNDAIAVVYTLLSEIRNGMDSVAANIKEYLQKRLEETYESIEMSQLSNPDENHFQNPNSCGVEQCDSED